MNSFALSLSLTSKMPVAGLAYVGWCVVWVTVMTDAFIMCGANLDIQNSPAMTALKRAGERTAGAIK